MSSIPAPHPPTPLFFFSPKMRFGRASYLGPKLWLWECLLNCSLTLEIPELCEHLHQLHLSMVPGMLLQLRSKTALFQQTSLPCSLSLAGIQEADVLGSELPGRPGLVSVPRAHNILQELHLVMWHLLSLGERRYSSLIYNIIVAR